MTRRLAVLLALGVAACGGRQHASTPAPQTPNETLAQFLAAVKANDLTKMGTLWGSEDGPAAGRMSANDLSQRLTIIQRYLDHAGYRVVEGPTPVQSVNPTFRNVPSRDKLLGFRVELQRDQCNRVVPIDLVRTKSGGWLVWDVHLESAGNPRSGCQQQAPPGTRP